MPNCFTLTPKGQTEPARLKDVDNKLREAFHQPQDDEHYLWFWYNTIGLALAMGKNWDWLRERLADDENLCAVANWLEGRYDVDSWAER